MNRFVLIVVSLGVASVATAAEPIVERANGMESFDNQAVLFSHESVMLGLTCKSGPVGRISNLGHVKLGDSISIGGKVLVVGLIEVTTYTEDIKSGGQVIARKGDVVCVAAASEKTLPYNDKCNALWLHVEKCRVLK